MQFQPVFSSAQRHKDLRVLCEQMWRIVMGVVYVAVAVLSLLSVGQSAPVTDCESLVRPLEIQGKDQLLGNWVVIADTTDIAGSNVLTKMVENAWVKMAPSNESNVLMHYEAAKILGKCFTLRTKMTLEKSTLLMTSPFNASAVLLNTSCPDCLIVHSKVFFGGETGTGLQLLSRRNTVSAAEKDEFLLHVDCLDLQSPLISDSKKDLCPEDSFSEGSSAIDLTDTVNIVFKMIELLQTLFGEDGVMELVSKLFDD